VAQTALLNICDYSVLIDSIYNFPGTKEIKGQVLKFVCAAISSDYKTAEIEFLWVTLEGENKSKKIILKLTEKYWLAEEENLEILEIID
jgi:hypothetical protein